MEVKEWGTIQPEHEIPIKDPTGDMTLVSRGRGSGSSSGSSSGSCSTTRGSSSSWLTVSLLGTVGEAAWHWEFFRRLNPIWRSYTFSRSSSPWHSRKKPQGYSKNLSELELDWEEFWGDNFQRVQRKAANRERKGWQLLSRTLWWSSCLARGRYRWWWQSRTRIMLGRRRRSTS